MHAPVVAAVAVPAAATPASAPGGGKPATGSGLPPGEAPPTGGRHGGASRTRRGYLTRLLTLFLGAFGWRRVHASNALEHNVRDAILRLLSDAPGLHLRGIARALELTPQNAQHHLRKLTDLGVVARTRVSGRHCYYAKDAGCPARDAARAAGAVGRGTGARVLQLLAAHPGLHQAEIARRLGERHGTVSWSVKQLVKADLLSETRDGNRLRYRVTSTAMPALAASTPPTPASGAGTPVA